MPCTEGMNSSSGAGIQLCKGVVKGEGVAASRLRFFGLAAGYGVEEVDFAVLSDFFEDA